MSGDIEFNSWRPLVASTDDDDDAGASAADEAPVDPGATAAPDLTGVSDPFAALGFDTSSTPAVALPDVFDTLDDVSVAVPAVQDDAPVDDGPPDPEAEFYDIIL